jgi:hypothetical protein
VDQQRRTEHAPLRATRPWTTCARTRSGSERTRSSALPSHHILICLQPLHMVYWSCARINQTVGGPKNQNYCIPLSYTTLPYHCSN